MKIADQLIFRLEKDILEGKYSPGSKFPSERELAELYNVSRATARETVLSLSQRGFLDTKPQSGSIVSDYEVESSLDLLIHIMKHHEADPELLLPLIDFRKIVEVNAAGEAARRSGPDDVRVLSDIIHREAIPGINPSEMTECDYQLHKTIVRMSGNIVIMLVFNSFKPIYRTYTELFFGLNGTIAATVDQHKNLFTAIAERDPKKAMILMEDALDYGARKVREALGIDIDQNKTQRTIANYDALS